MISQSNSIKRFISELLIFAKLLLKISYKVFEARVTMVEHVFFVLLRPHGLIFVQQIYSLNTTEHNPLDCVQLSWVAKLNKTQSNGLHSVVFN